MCLVSFVICSHKAPDTLYRTLQSIIEQVEDDHVEIILVNNGFSSKIEQEIFEFVTRLGKSERFLVINEPKSGLGNARIAGFLNSTGKFLVLLDDDNYIASDFIQKLGDVLSRMPNLGGICPLVTADWEQCPDEWLQDFGRYCLSYNASGKFHPPLTEKEWSASQFDQVIRPPGGGMIVNRIVAEAYLKAATDQRRINLSRQPNSLVGCEDYDLYSFVGELSMTSFFTDKLKVFHIIPATRTKIRYLSRLNFQMIYSFGILRVLRSEESSSNILILFKTVINIILNLMSIFTVTSRGKKTFLLILRDIGYVIGVFHGRRIIAG